LPEQLDSKPSLFLPQPPTSSSARASEFGISFARDATGVVSGLVLHQNGNHAAPKLSGSELPPEVREMALEAATLGDYVGNYRASFGVLEVVLKSSYLEAQITGQPAFAIFANAKDTFFYKIVDARLAFERNAEGKVVAVVLHQGGGQIRARRMETQE
jgi:serine-type D-Ala-D-Ala carboxypeptidase/endopeptidase